MDIYIYVMDIYVYIYIPPGKQTWLLKIAIYSGFTMIYPLKVVIFHSQLLVYQRVMDM